MRSAEYLTLDATALAGLVADGSVTPAELLALARERCDAVNPRINAVVVAMTEIADARVADGGLSGPFAGVPFLIKDPRPGVRRPPDVVRVAGPDWRCRRGARPGDPAVPGRRAGRPRQDQHP